MSSDSGEEEKGLVARQQFARTKRLLLVLALLAIFGLVRLPIETRLDVEQRQAAFRSARLDLSLRQQLTQTTFLAALSGFRSLVAAYLWIEAYTEWQKLQWGPMARLLETVTTLQPRSPLYWDMSGWHMAWNAAAAAMEDKSQPSEILRRRAQRQYIELGRKFYEDGLKNLPDSMVLHEGYARLLRDKLEDHCAAAREYLKASQLPEALPYLRRFAAYELAACPGHEREAYAMLRSLYDEGPEERKGTLIALLEELETKLGIPASERINK